MLYRLFAAPAPNKDIAVTRTSKYGQSKLQKQFWNNLEESPLASNHCEGVNFRVLLLLFGQAPKILNGV